MRAVLVQGQNARYNINTRRSVRWLDELNYAWCLPVHISVRVTVVCYSYTSARVSGTFVYGCVFLLSIVETAKKLRVVGHRVTETEWNPV